MIEISELQMNLKKGNLVLKRVYVEKDFSVACVEIPENTNVYDSEALRQFLLVYKRELEAANFPSVFFFLYQGNNCYACKIDPWQRCICSVDNPADFFVTFTITKEEDQMLRFIKAMNASKGE